MHTIGEHKMIELKNIVIKYGDFTAVHGLNLSINEGEFFTLLGPSGCGKTTTLRAIAGFETPVSGTIHAFGKDISGLLPEERDTGFVFQNYALFPSMTVYENIAYGLKAHRVPRKEIEKKVRVIAEKTGISEHLSKHINNLSGGQQQRVAIARALVMEPKVLLMDEPLSNLDAKLRTSTREEIRKLQRMFGITTIYVTHDQEEAMAISDRIAVFHEGKLEQVGTPKEIYNKPATGVVARFIGDINELKGEADKMCRDKLNADENENLYIRPHKLAMSKNKPSNANDIFCIEAKVDNYEYLGSMTKINAITNDGKKLTSLMFGAETEYEIDEAIYVFCDLKDVYVLKEA